MARRSGLKQAQSGSYKVSRAFGDAAALSRSPLSYGKRRARRYLTRSLFSLLK